MNDDFQGITAGFIGLPILVAGLLELAGGIPMVVLGNARMRRWVGEGALDRGSSSTLERYSTDRPWRALPERRVLVQPTFERGGAGLAIQLRF